MCETKICSKCNEEKPLDNYCKCSKSLDGLYCWCYDCRQTYNKIKRAKLKRVCTSCLKNRHKNFFTGDSKMCDPCLEHAEEQEIGVRTCDYCKEEKELSKFNLREIICNSCKTAKKREKAIEMIRLNPTGVKTCYKCNKEKDLDCFRITSNKCKPCELEYNRDWRKKILVEQEESEFGRCMKCHKTKPIDDFINGIRKCKLCAIDDQHRYKDRLREKLGEKGFKKFEEKWKKYQKNRIKNNVDSLNDEYIYSILAISKPIRDAIDFSSIVSLERLTLLGKRVADASLKGKDLDQFQDALDVILREGEG